MAIKKFYVGVKGIIKDPRGILLLQYRNGHWDVPGGRMNDAEDVESTLKREIVEELPGSKVEKIADLKGVYFLPDKKFEGDLYLVLHYYTVEATLPEKILLTEEHKSYRWIVSPDQLNLDGLYPEIAHIISKVLK